MTNEQTAKCHAIIHANSVAAGAVGAGLAQLPASDSIVIIPIQIEMTILLGKVFELEISETAAASLTATSLSTLAGRGISQVLIGWMPGIGNIINCCTAAGVTESLGWIIADMFDKQTSQNT